jgi:ribose-phosphate pyrophosphokinase
MNVLELYGPGGFVAGVPNIETYSDGCPFVKLDDIQDALGQTDTIVVRPRKMTDLIAMLCFATTSVVKFGEPIANLIIPYVPGSRQDRVNITGDLLSTTIWVNNAIDQQRFAKVVTLDPHSKRCLSRVGTAYSLESLAIIVQDKLKRTYDAILCPDNGAVDRATVFARVLKIPVVFGSKIRDVSTGRLSGFDAPVSFGKHYLVVDDICDGGGTFIGLAEEVKKKGAFADLYVTHGVFSKGLDEINKYYQAVYTTDSLVQTESSIVVIDVVPSIIDYVRTSNS